MNPSSISKGNFEPMVTANYHIMIATKDKLRTIQAEKLDTIKLDIHLEYEIAQIQDLLKEITDLLLHPWPKAI